MLTITARSTGQKWAVAPAAAQWASDSGRAATTLAQLDGVAQQCDTVADILANMPRPDERLVYLFRDFASVGHSLTLVGEAETTRAARRALERNRQELDSLKISAGALKRNDLSLMAEHWQRLIHETGAQLEAEPESVLAGAYQAGSALETGSVLFRGRRDLFALTTEIYANPQRAETLLLVAQQRMGKSSALLQLPAQLPDAHVVVVDCQGFLAGRGDDMFAAGLSGDIIRWERLRPGGARNRPLALEEVATHPLTRLNQWLEEYASAIRSKRVLLCLDEFDKLVQFVASDKLSEDVLALMRGLSQSPGWMVLYSGQYELDDWSERFAEYLKNVRRHRISYLLEEEARTLIEQPVPDFALSWEPEATEAVLYHTHRQPFLIQMIGSAIVNLLTPTKRRTVTEADVETVVPTIPDVGRYYFQSLENAFDSATNFVLSDIARSGKADADKAILHRLVDREYLEPDGEGWRFCVPLLAQWWRYRN